MYLHVIQNSSQFKLILISKLTKAQFIINKEI